MSAIASNEPEVSSRESELKRAAATPSNIEPLACVSPYKSLESYHKSLPTGELMGLPTGKALHRNSSNVSLDSTPGPSLPVHFSEFSIASDKDSYDPWSRMRDSMVESTPLGSAPARLLRLLRARLVTLAVGAPMGRPAHWVPSHTASGARTSRLQSCPSPRLRPSRRERAAEMHETDTVVRLPSFVTRPVHSSTLTSPSFRRLADQGRSLTASAPPGVRPPCARKRSLLVCYESDHGEPRRESSSPLIRPPVRPLP